MNSTPRKSQDAATPAGEQSAVPQRSAFGWLVACCLTWMAVGWYSFWNNHGPAPVLDESVAAGFEERFSAGRAIRLVERLVGDGEPHPAGSPHNDVVRDRLAGSIRELGFEPQIQVAEHRRWRLGEGKTYPLENVWFELPADAPVQNPRTLLLLAHYDSVPTGPGAGDDAAGVATVLETARMLKALSGRRHHVLCLITDGEELGLLGADRFLAEHPRARDVDLCMNFEGRGNRGPSLMFQTGPNNVGPVRLMADALSRPFSSSLYEAVYRRMPNGSDFTLFLDRGIGGFNFAFIGNVRAYHQPEDSAANLDLRSLQHHGDNAWELARVLVTEDSWPANEGGAVWFDVLGIGLVWWPKWMTLPLAIVGLLATWWGTTSRIKGAESSIPGARLRSSLAVVLIVCATAAVLSGVMWLAALDKRLGVPWPDDRTAVLLMAGLGAGALALTAAAVRVCGALRAWPTTPAEAGVEACSGSLVLAALLALVLAGLAAEVSYLILVPALAGALAVVLSRLSPGQANWGLAVGPFVAGLVSLPLVPSLFDALGFRLPLLWPVVFAGLGSSLTGLMVRTREKQLDHFSLLWLGAALICLAASVVSAHAVDG